MKRLTQLGVLVLLLLYTVTIVFSVIALQDTTSQELQQRVQVMENEVTLLNRETSLLKATSAKGLTPELTRDLEIAREKLEQFTLQRVELGNEILEQQESKENKGQILKLLLLAVTGASLSVVYIVVKPRDRE